jgi:hypothetical protein
VRPVVDPRVALTSTDTALWEQDRPPAKPARLGETSPPERLVS